MRTYEIAIREDLERETVIATLEALGYRIVEVYSHLERNLRVAPPDGMADADARTALTESHLTVGAPSASDDVVCRGTVALTTTVGTPLDRDRLTFSDQDATSTGTATYADAVRFGANWGVARVTDQVPARNRSKLPRIWELNDGDVTVQYESSRDGNGVIYYALDSGVDGDHPEYSEGVYGYRASIISDTVYQVNDDDQNHGTHVTGAHCGNNFGVARGCEVRVAKVLDGLNLGTRAAFLAGANAVVSDYTTQERPGVVNMSLSFVDPVIPPEIDSGLTSMANAGLTMMASMGNEYLDLSPGDVDYWPAEDSRVLAVGSTDYTDQVSRFSNFGTPLDVWVPGRSIAGPIRGGEAGWLNGTSMACGLSSAIVGCFLQGYAKTTTAAQATIVRNYVLTQVELIAVRTTEVINANTTQNTLILNVDPQPFQSRIAGINNHLVPIGNYIRQASVIQSFTRGPALAPTPLARIDPRESALRSWAPIVRSGEFTSTSTGSWRRRNATFVDQDAAVTPNLLGRIIDLTTAGNDGQGTPLQFDTTMTHCMFGSSNTTSSTTGITNFYHHVPLRALDSPVYDLTQDGTNLDWGSGNATGWTVTGGTLVVAVNNGATWPFSETHLAEGNVTTIGNTVRAEQIVTVTNLDNDRIDTGALRALIETPLGTTSLSTPRDECRVIVDALPAAGSTALATLFDTGTQVTGTALGWDEPGRLGIVDAVIPTLTRRIRIRFDWTLRLGSRVNVPSDGIRMLVYGGGAAGDRVVEAVDLGATQAEARWLQRALNIEADDQGRVGIEALDVDFNVLASSTDTFKSPYKWTTSYNRLLLPPGTRALRLDAQQNFRSGTAVNAYMGRFSCRILDGQPDRPEQSVTPSVTPSPDPGITVRDVGGAAGTTITVIS